MIYYDLHIHSCLSPCADQTMTPNNIVNMAMLIGLKAISVTDHNSMKQQKALLACAKRVKMDYLIGVELQTREEVHILGYFAKEEQIDPFQQWIDEHSSGMPNNIAYFGHQTIMNDQDEIVGEENQLLLDSLNASLEECVSAIAGFGGKAVLAHAIYRGNGIITQLGFIPPQLQVAGIEVRNLSQIAAIKENSPWIQDGLWLCSSDAHQLVDIHECDYSLSSTQWRFLKGETT